MIEATAEIDIDAPVERVFDYVADARNEPQWLPGAKDVAMVTAGEVSEGTRFEGTYARAGHVELEIVACERPRSVTIRGRSRIVHFDDAIELLAVAGGTRLKARMTAAPQGPMRLMAPLIGRTMRAQFTANWIHLKRVLESSPVAPQDL
jgi:uncharacterized protein YndB with AHSA1/START domain